MYTLLKWKQSRKESLLTKAECLIKSGWKITLSWKKWQAIMSGLHASN